MTATVSSPRGWRRTATTAQRNGSSILARCAAIAPYPRMTTRWPRSSVEACRRRRYSREPVGVRIGRALREDRRRELSGKQELVVMRLRLLREQVQRGFGELVVAEYFHVRSRYAGAIEPTVWPRAAATFYEVPLPHQRISSDHLW